MIRVAHGQLSGQQVEDNLEQFGGYFFQNFGHFLKFLPFFLNFGHLKKNFDHFSSKY